MSAKKRKFLVSIEVEVELEVSDKIVEIARSAEWQRQFYAFTDDKQVASYLAYNFVREGIDDIRKLDGFADRKPEDVVLRGVEWSVADVDELK